ncbi:hypothetical protein MLD38_023852 [Melastoma candidum]|uniref:Uncharacterized protein n=1 Tax=Melastoma candidum TaxID=119954 RepID=A0ACB9NTV7_9MYRT|nr:hypothetical protein MLD38_023852 [Melastoma candidum]
MAVDVKSDFDEELVGSPVEVDGDKAGDENDMGPSSVDGEGDGEFMQVFEEKTDQESPDRNGVLDELPSPIPSVASTDEPFVGLEFNSEAAAHAFYNSYATRVGFVIRVSKLSRSRRDGSAIGRAFVCNKEGYRMPDKREKILRQRAETRVGCRAMLVVRKVSTDKWVVSKFVKEHTHPLTPGKGRRDCIYDQYPDAHDKIRELSQQLAIEKKRASAYKRHLDLLFEHIESYNESLAKKIKHIVDGVRELESRDVPGHG